MAGIKCRLRTKQETKLPNLKLRKVNKIIIDMLIIPELLDR